MVRVLFIYLRVRIFIEASKLRSVPILGNGVDIRCSKFWLFYLSRCFLIKKKQEKKVTIVMTQCVFAIALYRAARTCPNL